LYRGKRDKACEVVINTKSIAKTTEEARKLSEDGFDYVCTTPEDIMLFKKRK